MSRCHTCHNHSHSCTCHSSCNDPCGCPQQIKGSCVFYQGGNLSCLDVTKGDDYDSILSNLNAIVCDLVTPSGNTTVVAPCNSNIIVTPVTVGSTTTYTVCLSSDVTDDILDNTTNILNLQNCVTNTVANIVSDTLTISTESHNSCGNVLRLEIPTPSGIPIVDGIIYNNINKNGTSIGTGDKFLKTVKIDDYYDASSLVEGDEIRFRANGQIMGDGATVDQVRIELYDTSLSTLLANKTFTGFDRINKQSWSADCVLTLGTGGDGLFNIEFAGNAVANGIGGNFTTVSKLTTNVDVSGIVLTGLQIRIVYAHFSTSGPSNNFARQLMIEVRKKI